MTGERLYTEKQARIWGLREYCARWGGHNIERLTEDGYGRPLADAYVCTRCDVVITCAYPLLPPAGWFDESDGDTEPKLIYGAVGEVDFNSVVSASGGGFRDTAVDFESDDDETDGTADAAASP